MVRSEQQTTSTMVQNMTVQQEYEERISKFTQNYQSSHLVNKFEGDANLPQITAEQ